MSVIIRTVLRSLYFALSHGEEYDNFYALKLYDTNLLIFSMKNDVFEGLKSRIIEINYGKKKFLPPDLELSDSGLSSWLKRRLIPKNRAFVHEILRTLGLRMNDTKAIIDVCKGLSLNDSYWVVPLDFHGSFNQFNLYENNFSEILSLVAYTGAGRTHEAFTTSPEFTTHGMLRKAWRKEHDGIYLYKGGTEGAANAGREPYSEFYACQIGERMKLRAVHYDLVKWKNILASKCKLFTDINTAYIPVGHLIKYGGLSSCINYFRNISDEAYEDLKSMLVFDALIYNEDRHFGNFGVLMDSRTCRITGAAPIFDNGVSLFNYAMKDDYRYLDDYAKTRMPYSGSSFMDICAEVLGERQRKELKRMIGFRFKRHPRYNLPEFILKSIERHLKLRVVELLCLPKRKTS